jgi:hypothetical protein
MRRPRLPAPLSTTAVVSTARSLIATMVTALPAGPDARAARLVLDRGHPPLRGSIAGRLWTRLTPRRSTPGGPVAPASASTEVRPRNRRSGAGGEQAPTIYRTSTVQTRPRAPAFTLTQPSPRQTSSRSLPSPRTNGRVAVRLATNATLPLGASDPCRGDRRMAPAQERPVF